MSQDDVPPIRLSMTLPGAASLGAFQAGALAALSVVIRSLRTQGRGVYVDAVGGSSAGAIVGMLASHCLLSGRDAPTMLSDAWVDEVDLELLRCGKSDAPLAFDDLQQRLRSFLDDEDAHPFGVHEPLGSALSFDVGLTSLLGFNRPVEAAGGRTSTLTYVDWLRYELSPGQTMRQLVDPEGSSLLEAVLVSAAHPGALAPRRIDHRARSDDSRDRTVDNVERGDTLWYTDGGLVESRPVSRIVEAARMRAGSSSGTRVHVVVDPRSSGPSGNERWADPDDPKTWIDGLRRALSVLPTQALHDDLRSLAATNEQLRFLDDAVATMSSRLADAGESVDESQLRADLARIGRLEGKDHVDIEMISPLWVSTDDEQGVNDLLAGDFIGAFGGFVDRRIRRSDYALGWSSTSEWVEESLPRYGISASDVDEIRSAIDEATKESWSDAVIEGDAVDHLGTRGRWQLALLAYRIGRVLVAEAAPSPRDTIAGWFR